MSLVYSAQAWAEADPPRCPGPAAMQMWGCLAAVAQLCVEAGYLALQAAGRRYMVSDGLAHSPAYLAGLSASLLAGLAVCGLYLAAHLRTPRGREAALGCILVKGAAAAWATLALEPDGVVHEAATCTFMACSTGYALVLLALHRDDVHTQAAHAAYDAAGAALVALACGAGVLFLVVFHTDHANAWIPEQLGMLLATAAQLAFFYNHRPRGAYQTLDATPPRADADATPRAPAHY